MSMPGYLAPPELAGAGAYARWGDHRHLGSLLAQASRVTVLSGAGLSAPSGIPTYRGTDGRWGVEEPVLHGEFVRGGPGALAQWRRSLRDFDAFSSASPNAGHAALVRLSARTQTFLATQNVDGLHGASGFPARSLAELHGNGTRAVCLSCDARVPLGGTAIRAGVAAGRVPDCQACGGMLKPDVTLFGAGLPKGAMERSSAAARDCVVFLAVGTSLTVQPAAGLLEVAAEGGAVIVIAVDAVTPYHGAAHLLLAGDACEALDLAVPA